MIPDSKETPIRFSDELQKVYNSFYNKPKTMRQVEVETGVRRDHITRYVDTLKKNNKITIVNKGVCPITNRDGVQFLTTDPSFQPKFLQLSLFNQ